MQQLLGDDLQDELLPISNSSSSSIPGGAADSQLAPPPDPDAEFLLDVGVSVGDEVHSAGNARDGHRVREAERPPPAYPLKLVFASRTHSQLAQVLREFARTAYAQRLTAVTLSSRLVRHSLTHSSGTRALCFSFNAFVYS